MAAILLEGKTVAELLKARIRAEAKAKADEKAKPAAKKTTKGKAAEPCPLTHKDVLALAKKLKIKPHEGASSPENVWGCVGRVLTLVTKANDQHLRLVDLVAELEDYGSDCVALACEHLVGDGKLERFKKPPAKGEHFKLSE